MSMDLIMSLLMETGSFDTDVKRSQNELVKLEKISKQLTKTLAEVNQASDSFIGPLQPGKMRPAIDGVENLNRAVQKSQSGFRASNQVIQQASYQVTDFVVQVSGGVSALRAFGQQAPQFLAAFGGTGALIGVFAALGSAIADVVMKSSDSQSMGDSFKKLEEASKGLKSSLEITGKIDLSSLGKNYREATDEGKKLIDANVRLSLLMLDMAKVDATIGFREGIKKSLDDIGFFAKAWNLVVNSAKYARGDVSPSETTQFADIKKITEEQAASIDKAQKSFGNAKISAADYINTLTGIAEQYKGKISPAFKEFIDDQVKYANQLQGIRDLEASAKAARDNNYQGLENNSKSIEQFISKVQELKAKLSELTYGKVDTSELAAFNDRYAAGAEKVSASQAEVLRGIYAQIDAQKQLNQDTADINSLMSSYDSYSQKLQKIYDDQLRIYDLRERGKISQEQETSLIAGTQQAIDTLNEKSMKLGMTMQQAFGSAIQQGVAGIVDVLFEADKSFAQFVDSFAKSIAKMIMQLMILKGIKMALSGTSVGDFLFGTTKADGGIFTPNGESKFANGGVFTNSIVTKPTAFAYGGAFGSQAGLMGEAGPEAIVPLKRSSTGKLGVGAAPSNVVINVTNEGGADGYRATATAQKNDNGIDIDIIVRKAVTSDLQRNGPMAQQMSNTFNLRRGA